MCISHARTAPVFLAFKHFNDSMGMDSASERSHARYAVQLPARPRRVGRYRRSRRMAIRCHPALGSHTDRMRLLLTEESGSGSVDRQSAEFRRDAKMVIPRG